MKRLTLAFVTVLAGGIFAAAAVADTPDTASPSPAPTDSAGCNSGTCDSNCNCNGDGCCNNGCCDYDLCCPDLPTCHLFDGCCCLQQCDTTMTGWIEGGIMGNADGPSTHFNGPVTFPDDDRGQLNQFYGVLQRTTDLSKNCGWFLGYDVDFFYGSDFFFTTAAGLDGTKLGNVPRWNTDSDRNYGYSMPQLYVETDYDDLRVKWGHFYTIIGYEVVPAIGNFFYTHSYTMQYGEPFTHTGVLASRAINDNWTWSGGIVGGWNDFSLQEGAQFLGGLTYSQSDCTKLAFSIVSGPESDYNVPGIHPESNRTMYSIVWSNNLSSRLTYVLQHDLGVQQNTQGFNAFDDKTADWYGINQYLFYKLNCCWTAGWRFEWFDDPQGYVVTGLRPGNTDSRGRFPGSFYETSFGLNYKPNGNFTLRPEVRYDWYTGPGGFTAPGVKAPPPNNQPFNDNLDKNQFLFGLDAIWQY
jgi:Putative beta-barrel porin-2, OmpL-like. bbp2